VTSTTSEKKLPKCEVSFPSVITVTTHFYFCKTWYRINGVNIHKKAVVFPFGMAVTRTMWRSWAVKMHVNCLFTQTHLET